MPEKTITAREFHQNTAAATRAAEKGPVIVTKRGQPRLVLMRFEEYSNLGPRAPKKSSKEKSIVELLAMPDGTPAFDFDFEEFRSTVEPREIDLG